MNEYRDQLCAKWKPMLEHCESLSNWTTGGELAWLAEMASTRKLIAEIGSYKGKSAKAMAWGSSAIIHCVDTFERGSRTEFEQNLKSEFEAERLYIHQLSSPLAAKKLSHLRFDMIFIDADHDAESVKTDILSWVTLLTPNGLLCGHDWWPNDPENGIHKALMELPFSFKPAVDSIWVKI